MEQYVKGFQRFHACEDVRPVTSCKFLLYYYCYYYYHFCCRCCCCRWWHWLLGLIVLRPSISSLLRSATSVITKCDSFFYYKERWSVITKCDSFFITKCDKYYYKVRQVLQSVTILLQSATGITKCDDYYKVRQYTVLSIGTRFSARSRRPLGSSLPWDTLVTFGSFTAISSVAAWYPRGTGFAMHDRNPSKEDGSSLAN